MTQSFHWVGLGRDLTFRLGLVGISQPVDRLSLIGLHKMDRWTIPPQHDALLSREQWSPHTFRTARSSKERNNITLWFVCAARVYRCTLSGRPVPTIPFDMRCLTASTAVWRTFRRCCTIQVHTVAMALSRMVNSVIVARIPRCRYEVNKLSSNACALSVY